MSHIYNYSKELVPISQDPKERAAAIKTRRGAAGTFSSERINPRIRPIPVKNSSVTVPLRYLAVSRIKEWLKR